MIERRSNSWPTILSKTDALEYAAEKLAAMAHDMDIARLLFSVIEVDKLSGEAREKADEFRRNVPDPDLHARACRDAARAIRETAIEERLVAARVGAASVRSGGGVNHA